MAADRLLTLRTGSCCLAGTQANPTTARSSGREKLLRSADLIMCGHWRVFDRDRTDIGSSIDWFLEPNTGSRAPHSVYCFSIDYNCPTVGDVKYIWELSRHHHLTVLAAAYAITGADRYARRVEEHLRSWWRDNPFLCGINWSSGIELGVRLIAWVWIRRLLTAWPRSAALFEANSVFLDQLYSHQYYLARLRSRGSSANNHLLAEISGLFASACAFPCFAESEAWRKQSAAALEREVLKQTFPSGIDRELATEYHGFVLEVAFAAALEGDAAGRPLSSAVWRRLEAMIDVIAAMVDEAGRPPRQGDSDDGIGLLLDGAPFNRWHSLLATGAALFGALDWWPSYGRDDLRTHFWTALTARRGVRTGDRPERLPSYFSDAGTVLLRAQPHCSDEIWCRCDGGPHGFLSIAAHAHADSLSVEVRYGGVDILCDPGTYGYFTAPRWRSYFRSTLAHNTLELDGQDQSVAAGRFLWTHQARCETKSASGFDDGPVAVWEGAHDGYRRLTPPAVHRRRVVLRRTTQCLIIDDQIESAGPHLCRLTFHLGSDVLAHLERHQAQLTWSTRGAYHSALLTLPIGLSWRAARGEDDPPLGWFSPSYGVRIPTTTLIGEGTLEPGVLLSTCLTFNQVPRGARATDSGILKSVHPSIETQDWPHV